MINVCHQCGEQFNSRVFAKWCDECRPIVRRQQARQYYAENRELYRERYKAAYRKKKEARASGNIKTCVVCGREFIPLFAREKVCSLKCKVKAAMVARRLRREEKA